MELTENHNTSLSRRHILTIGFTTIGLIGVLDYHTGPQISASLFYLLPILYITHYTSRNVGILAAFLATSLWFTADVTPVSHTGGLAVPSWNAGMRFGVFLITVWLVSSMKRLSDSLEKRVAERTEQLRAEADERRKLEEQILDISEREQARMGQDLHDGLCQHLIGTVFSANLLQSKMSAKGLTEATELQGITSLIDASITQARQMARGLYPVRIEDMGLVIALTELVENSENLYRVNCGFSTQGNPPNLDQAIAVHIYRIAQEAVINAMKHARPTHVWVSLRFNSNEIQLRVDDDGIGIPEGKTQGNGIGLKIIEFRARMIGGTLQVKRRVSGGTTVMCSLVTPKG